MWKQSVKPKLYNKCVTSVFVYVDGNNQSYHCLFGDELLNFSLFESSDCRGEFDVRPSTEINKLLITFKCHYLFLCTVCKI